MVDTSTPHATGIVAVRVTIVLICMYILPSTTTLQLPHRVRYLLSEAYDDT